VELGLFLGCASFLLMGKNREDKKGG
jgi:hypothetical protein